MSCGVNFMTSGFLYTSQSTFSFSILQAKLHFLQKRQENAVCLLRLGLAVTGAPAEPFGTRIHGVRKKVAGGCCCSLLAVSVAVRFLVKDKNEPKHFL